MFAEAPNQSFFLLSNRFFKSWPDLIARNNSRGSKQICDADFRICGASANSNNNLTRLSLFKHCEKLSAQIIEISQFLNAFDSWPQFHAIVEQQSKEESFCLSVA